MPRRAHTHLAPFLAALVTGFVMVLATGFGSAPVAAQQPDAGRTTGRTTGEAVTVAVAANFFDTAEALGRAYEYESGQAVRLVAGSTGRLYAQIRAGAPFDVFLSADADRPARLLADGMAVARKTYAVGRLVLVAPGGAEGDVAALLRGRRVAIADPAVAPYGVAALEAIRNAGVDPGEMRLLYGDSVGQAAALFATGNAERAILSQAQLPGLGEGLRVVSLDEGHAAIRQDAALTGYGEVRGRRFYDWLSGGTARTMIDRAGYGPPE